MADDTGDIEEDLPFTFGDGADRFSGASGLLFEQAMAQTRMAICLTDPHQDDAPIIFANRAFRALTGYSNEEIVGRNCRFLQGPETDEATVARIRTALQQEDVLITEILNYRKDGTRFWNALHLGPIYNAEGQLLYFFGSQWDVTDVHTARADEQHAKTLARELSHRMKNMFSVIGAIVSLTGRQHQETELTEKINGRVRALGRAHEKALAAPPGQRLDLQDVIRSVLLAYDPGGGHRLRLSGDNVPADPNLLSLLGLLLHELATNATKYGALSAETGTVDLTWRRDGEYLKLHWRERGGPPILDKPAIGGVGSGLVEALVSNAGGQIEVDWKRQGVDAMVALLLPRA